MTMTGHVARWARRCLDAALVLLVVVSLLTVILARVVPMTGRSTFVVAGGSMAPTIGVGSAVIVDPVDPSLLAVGDVVSLRSGSERAIFTHRITRVVDREGTVWIETQGDANRTPDPSISPATNVIGRVSLAIPFAGYLIALLSSPRGIVFVMLLGVLLLFAGWMLDSAGHGRRRVPAERSAQEEVPIGVADPV